MSATLSQNSTNYPEPSSIAFSISVLIHRISTLPPEDRNDLYLLVKDLSSANTSEESESIGQAMLEILDQRTETVERFDVEPKASGLNLKWKAFISQRIKESRTEKGLTQGELAERSGIPQSHVSRIENAVHSPSRKTLERLAAALEIPVSTFDPGFE